MVTAWKRVAHRIGFLISRARFRWRYQITGNPRRNDDDGRR
jgi:hypothetical protein